MNSLKIKNKKKNDFLHSVLILVGGTAFSQLISILCLPILTRIYSPQAFSEFAFYSASVGIFSVIACLRYDMGLPLLKRKIYTQSILLITIIIALILGVGSEIILLIIVSFNDIDIERKTTFLMIPIGVVSLAIFNSFNYYLISEKKFKTISSSRIIQSIFAMLCQIGFGVIGFLQYGLILGQIISNLAGITYQSKRKNFYINKKIINLWILITKKNLKRLSKFPLYSAPEAFVNTAGIQVPIIIIAMITIDSEAGYLLLAMKIMQAPVSLIGGAVSQVFYSKAIHAKQDGKLNNLVVESLTGLIKAGVFPLVFFGILAPTICMIVFGKEWERTGILISWMTPWFIMQLLSSPISTIMHVMNKQALMLTLTLFGFIVRIGSVVYAFFFIKGHEGEAYAVSGAIFYLICFIFFTKNSGLTIKLYLTIIKKVILFSTLAILIGTLINFGIEKWLLN